MSVALTPGATYAVVFVAVKADVLTKSVTVTSPLDAGGVDGADADNALPELVGVVTEASVIEAVVADDVEAGEAESEGVADKPNFVLVPNGDLLSCRSSSRLGKAFLREPGYPKALRRRSIIPIPNNFSA